MARPRFRPDCPDRRIPDRGRRRWSSHRRIGRRPPDRTAAPPAGGGEIAQLPICRNVSAAREYCGRCRLSSPAWASRSGLAGSGRRLSGEVAQAGWADWVTLTKPVCLPIPVLPASVSGWSSGSVAGSGLQFLVGDGGINWLSPVWPSTPLGSGLLLLRGLGAVLLVCDLPDCGLGAVGIIREDVLLSSAPQAQSQDGRQGYQGTGRRATEFDPLGGNRRLFGDRIGSGPLVLFSVYKLSLTDLLL